MVVFHPFPHCHSFLLITPIAVRCWKPRWGARTLCLSNGLCTNGSRLEPCRGRCVHPVLKARAGGAGCSAPLMLQRLCSLLGCAQNENRNNPVIIPLIPSEDGVFPPSHILCLPSGLQGQAAKMSTFLLPFLQEKLRLVSKWWMPLQVTEVSFCYGILITPLPFHYILTSSITMYISLFS